MGFSQKVKRAPIVKSNLITGMLDNGVWPESESFNDDGHLSILLQFHMQQELISIGPQVRSFQEIFLRRDIQKATAPTPLLQLQVEYSRMPACSALEQERPRRGVPSARFTVYKICWSDGCYDADILAALDDAIADGVDIISLSVWGAAQDYFNDPIAIGAFHSMKNGILTSNSAAISGPSAGSVSNVSP
ncbi:hypothetical protein RHMOL_Rhmol03G0154200 [Rhododendron molle]|uniref:Uncharacterized protein n=1 Tax=Rhododendron molle TaxID=49168 RepID=A0ACC0PED8_RHOML|nr:hypothetical protein RHMOL_Rhmol03G0154200 [Rhododendron molle]